jgi:[ribosomal protein S5]-alanine N-acetyltransferase
VHPEPGVLSDGVVTLRPWRDADAEWYAEAVSDPEILRFTAEPEGLTAEQVRAGFAAAAARPDVAGFAICDATTGELLGNGGLRRESAYVEVMYWVAAPARGRGTATSAVRLLAERARQVFGPGELRLWARAGNIASGRVAERVGFHRDFAHDRVRSVKGERWHDVAYRHSGD